MKLNACSQNAHTFLLDWEQHPLLNAAPQNDNIHTDGSQFFSSPLLNLHYDVIMATDVIYEDSHGRELPKFLAKFIVLHFKTSSSQKAQPTCLYFLLPDASYRTGIHVFEETMQLCDFLLISKQKIPYDTCFLPTDSIQFSETIFFLYHYQFKFSPTTHSSFCLDPTD
eukprot:Sdes_comp20006_c0_seq1m12668